MEADVQKTIQTHPQITALWTHSSRLIGKSRVKKGEVKSYVQRSTVKGSSLVAAINDFARTLRGTTVLVLDNASPHTCREVSEHIEKWAERGLILYNLPPYSPELNAIEHLWRKLKHQFIPPNGFGRRSTNWRSHSSHRSRGWGLSISSSQCLQFSGKTFGQLLRLRKSSSLCIAAVR